MNVVNDAFTSLQSLLVFALLIVQLGLKLWAAIDCVRHRTDAYPAAGKQTKPLWMGILFFALAVQIVVLAPLNFLNLLGAVAAIVYLVDARPALRQVRGGGQGNGKNMGPYGPW